MEDLKSEVFTLKLRCHEYEQRLSLVGLQGQTGESLQRTNTELHENVQALEERLRTALDSVQTLSKQLELARKESKGQKELEEKLIKGVQKLNDGNGTLKQRVSGLGMEKAALKAQVSALKDELAEKQKTESRLLEKVSRAESELEVYKGKVDQLELDINAKDVISVKLKREIELARNKHHQLEIQQEARNSKAIQKSQIEKNELEATLEALRTTKEADSVYVKQLRSETESLKKQLQIANKREIELEALYSKKSKEVATIEQDVRLHKEKSRHKVKELIANERQKHSIEIEKYKDRVDSLTRENTLCQEKLDSLQRAWARKTIEGRSKPKKVTMKTKEIPTAASILAEATNYARVENVSKNKKNPSNKVTRRKQAVQATIPTRNRQPSVSFQPVR